MTLKFPSKRGRQYSMRAPPAKLIINLTHSHWKWLRLSIAINFVRLFEWFTATSTPYHTLPPLIFRQSNFYCPSTSHHIDRRTRYSYMRIQKTMPTTIDQCTHAIHNATIDNGQILWVVFVWTKTMESASHSGHRRHMVFVPKPNVPPTWNGKMNHSICRNK